MPENKFIADDLMPKKNIFDKTNVQTFFYNTLLLIGSVAIATVIGSIFHILNVPETNIVTIYIFFVVLSICFVKKYAYAYGIVASIFSTLAFNIFFTVPYYAISVDDSSYLITFTVMIVISIIMGRLITAERENIKRIEQKELEVVQERYRSNLLRAISHDLRTPLSGIMGSSEMIQGITPKEDSRYKIAEGIYKDADWLYSLIENILSLTKLQENRLGMNRQTEPIEEVIEAAVRVLEKREPEREIKVNIPEETFWVCMDTRLMEQVLLNLLDNAVKHTGITEEISIQVSRSRDKKNVIITFSDRGEGIAEDDIAHIFQMFYTTCRGDSDSRKGVGLGLTICESIVKAHGGTIQAKNQIDGKGAIFEITLPCKEVNYEE